jgi:hypothetical protein
LVLATRSRQVLTYDLVARAIGVPRTGIGPLLGPIQAYCLANDLPALTALVVSEHSGLPGLGFIAVQGVPRAQAQVFRHDWLAGQVPTPDMLEAAYQANPQDVNIEA